MSEELLTEENLNEEQKQQIEELKEKGVNLGSLYDFNKELIKKSCKILKGNHLAAGIQNVVKDFIDQSQNQYYMMLCNDIKYYTLFNILNKKDKYNICREIQDCISYIGKCYSINLTGNKDAVEIWIENEDDLYCFYFFPYDLGVIEI